MRGPMIEANLSAATVPDTRTVWTRSPFPTTTVRMATTGAAGALDAVFRVRYQAAPRPTANRTNRIPHLPRRGCGGTGRGTIAGPAGAGATGNPVLGAGALLEND